MGILAPLALLGLLLGWRDPGLRPPRRLPVLAFLLLPVTSMSLFYVGSRFRLELEAILLPFAAAAVVRLVQEWARRQRRLAAAVAILMALLLGFLLHRPDREIARQERLRFIQLRTDLGRRAADASEAARELARARDAALYPAEAEGAWRALAAIDRTRGDGAAAERDEAFASGFLDDATLERLEALRDDPEALWAVGRHFMLKGEMPRAAEAFTGAARLAPDDPDILISRALAAQAAGTASTESVLAWTEEALDVGLRFSPNAPVAYRLAASCYETLGRHDAAREALRRAARY
jgi:tetratricopeptide (TPR) repeat protein